MIERVRWLRRAAVLGAAAGWAFSLSGYVTPPAQVVERWERSRGVGAVQEAQVLAVRWDGREGWLAVAPDGRHRLAVAGGGPQRARGAPGAEDLAALWLALDLWSAPDGQALLARMEAAGVDPARVGLARTGCSADGVAVTVGARGESDPQAAQVWFARDTGRPCRVAVPGARTVEIGPPGPAGWPAELRLEAEDVTRIEVLGPTSSPGRAAEPLSPATQGPAGGWREGFGAGE
ncbi:MAG: hypothetical protein Kow0092_32720 [Deferrisomatales bacterium]